MIININDITCTVLKKFNGEYNYFNPSHYNGKTIFRRETKYDNKVLVSDIVDDQNNVILKHYTDDKYLWSFEDTRFINHNEIGVCCCKRDINDLTKITTVEFKKYNLVTKQFTHYKTQNAHFEKHWQFYKDSIIYHVNPYTILDENEKIIYKNNIDWSCWIERYGKPGLSTNIFEVGDSKYLLFHSYTRLSDLHFKYYIGVLKINDDLSPIGYCYNPLFESNKNYTDSDLLNNLWNWRRTDLFEPIKYEVIFPMNVIVDNNINIYSGMNDCSAVKITLSTEDFSRWMYNTHFVN